VKGDFIEYLSSAGNGKRALFITTSNRWDGDDQLPKSTQLAYDMAKDLKSSGLEVIVMDVPKMKIYPCEGNVSTLKGNTCGLKDSSLKDDDKNPTGYHRCWASINHEDDELWKISKELFQADFIVFFISVRWGQANAFYQKLIERLNWIENRHTTLEEDNIVSGKQAGCVVIGQNWRTEDVMNVQKAVYEFYGFDVPEQLSFNWQYTQDVNDETEISYQKAPYTFQEVFSIKLKGAMAKIRESVSKFLGFSAFLNENTKFPHQIKSEKYWRQILTGNDFALKILDTVMKNQKGFASDRQMEVFRRVERGDKSPYPTKN
jgi:multimeric flavodoxin WrbA